MCASIRLVEPTCSQINGTITSVLQEMEAGAIAWVADLWKVPMFCIKSITDMVDTDSPSVQEFQDNLAAASKALEAIVPKVLTFISHKQVSQL